MRAPVTLSALVALLAGCLAGCKGMKEGYEKEFKTSYGREFTGSCVKAVVEKAGPAAEPKAKAACGCVATYMVEHHTVTELTKMSLNMGAAEAQGSVARAKEACKESFK